MCVPIPTGTWQKWRGVFLSFTSEGSVFIAFLSPFAFFIWEYAYPEKDLKHSLVNNWSLISHKDFKIGSKWSINLSGVNKDTSASGLLFPSSKKYLLNSSQ